MSMFDGLSRVFAGLGSPVDSRNAPTISCVVIVHDMSRQAENTLLSLSPAYQYGVDAQQYEVIIVENESPNLMRPEVIGSLPANFSYHLRKKPEPSPGAAINFGASLARGENICILIDGARMLSPGVLRNIILGHKLSDSAIVSTPGYHLGHQLQQEAVEVGYDTDSELQLLRSIDWPSDGYRLFEISCLNGSSLFGFFLPVSESNCISLPRRIWNRLSGYDTRFDLPGGGFINLDFYKRACEFAGVTHVILPGEGTFHQFHGGVTTGGRHNSARNAYIQACNQQYRLLRGQDYESPRTRPLVLGKIHEPALRFMSHSARAAMESAPGEYR